MSHTLLKCNRKIANTIICHIHYFSDVIFKEIIANDYCRIVAATTGVRAEAGQGFGCRPGSSWSCWSALWCPQLCSGCTLVSNRSSRTFEVISLKVNTWMFPSFRETQCDFSFSPPSSLFRSSWLAVVVLQSLFGLSFCCVSAQCRRLSNCGFVWRWFFFVWNAKMLEFMFT